jgi:hypothetical protein
MCQPKKVACRPLRRNPCHTIIQHGLARGRHCSQNTISHSGMPCYNTNSIGLVLLTSMNLYWSNDGRRWSMGAWPSVMLTANVGEGKWTGFLKIMVSLAGQRCDIDELKHALSFHTS